MDLSQLKPLETLSLQSAGSVSQVIFSPEQQSLATITTNPRGYLDKEVDLWKVSTGQRWWRWALSTTDPNISSLRFLSADVIELRLSTDMLVRLSVHTGKQLKLVKPAAQTLAARLIQHLKFTPAALAANQ